MGVHSNYGIITNLFSWGNDGESIQKLSRGEILGNLKKDILKGKNTTQKLLERVPLEQLISKAEVSESELVAISRAQQEFVSDSKKEHLVEKVRTVFSRHITEVISFFDHLVDTLLKSLGFYDIGREAAFEFEAKSRLELYVTILGYPSLVFLALAKVCTPIMAAVGTAAVLAATLLLIGAYVRYYKPCPSTLDGFTNWTLQAKRGKLEPVFGRDGEIAQLLATLENKQAVLLLGESGVGKTELIKGLAEKIAQGEAGAFNKKTVFSINAADIYDSTLAMVKERLSGYEQDVIIFIDEFQAAWEMRGINQVASSKLVQRLKTFIDLFPHVVAATTPEDYNKYKIDQDKAIVRRVHIQKILPMDRQHTKVVVSKTLQQQAPDVPIEQGSVEYLIDKVKKGKKELGEPATSKGVIFSAVKRLYKDPHNRVKIRQAELQQEIEVVKSAYRKGSSSELVRLEKALHDLQGLICEQDLLKQKKQKQDALIAQVKKIQAVWNAIKEDILVPNKELESQSRITDAHRKWVINSYFMLPAAEIALQELQAAPELKNVHTKISKRLIDELV